MIHKKEKDPIHVWAAAMLLVVLLPFGNEALAAAPVCYTHPTGPSYCQYTGTVEQVYVNTGNLILMYFDTPVDLTQPSAVGISGVTVSTATVFPIDNNATFAQYFYSTILAAQARGANVTIQMRGSSNGYLVVDRIWLRE